MAEECIRWRMLISLQGATKLFYDWKITYSAATIKYSMQFLAPGYQF